MAFLKTILVGVLAVFLLINIVNGAYIDVVEELSSSEEDVVKKGEDCTCMNYKYCDGRINSE